ncbi:hypothetical protein MBLNU13_g09039t1 [Cladosporium sp. NU13]
MQAGNPHDLEQQQFALGFGRVQLRHLYFETGIRDFDERNVNRLKLVFRTEGCHRDNPVNFIPALVSKADLEQSSNTRGHPAELLLPPDRRLLCLHGKHRILAAKAVLPLHDQWWTLAFYDEGMPHAVRESMIQQYTNELRFSDGDIFRFYRRAQQANDQKAVNKWLARLSASKKRNLMQLEKADHGRLIAALDALMPFVGLWQGFQLGAMNRIMPMRELSIYLSRILHFWNSVMEDFEPSELTPQTVLALHLRAPLFSLADSEDIRNALKLTLVSVGEHKRYKLFPRLAEPAQRERILQRLLSCPRILSFHSFFQDTIYLEACHSAMRNLLPTRQAYHNSFEAAFRDIFTGCDASFYESHLQLWLYSMRHMSELSDNITAQARKDRSRKPPVKSIVKASRVDAFAAFARNLGYEVIKGERGDEIGTNPPESDISVALGRPALSTDLVDVALKARCNRPFERSYLSDRKYMFPKYVLSKEVQEKCQYVTTFAVARDIVHSFWNPPGATLSDEATRESPVQETASQPEAMSATGLREADRARMTPLEIFADEMDVSTLDNTTFETPAQGDVSEAPVLEEVDTTHAISASQAGITGDQRMSGQGDLTRESTERQEAEADLYEEDETQTNKGSSVGTHAVVEAVPSAGGRKRAPDVTAGETRRVTDRSEDVIERSQRALDGCPDAWCVVDSSLQCHIGTGLALSDSRKLHAILNKYVKAYHHLRLYQNSSGRTLTVSRGDNSATAFRALQLEQPYRILLVTPRSTTRWDYLFVYSKGVQHVLAWQKTGDPDCRKLVLIHGQTEAIAWEKMIRVKTVSDPRKGVLHEGSEQVESDAAYQQRLDAERSGWSEITIVFERTTNPVQVSFECANDEWDQFLTDKSDFIWEEL